MITPTTRRFQNQMISVSSRNNPPAQVEPKSPCRLPCGQADQGTILLNDAFGVRTGEEVEVQNAANQSVLDQ